MPLKRPTITADVYNNTALDKIVGAAPPAQPPVDRSQEPAAQEKNPQHRNLEPTTFYLNDEQVTKLDELALAFKKRKKKRIGRNEIIRALVNQVDLQMLLDLIRVD
jgi:hypothetical protein